MDILDIIATNNYIIYNKTLAKQIGLENAILFGALCGYQRTFKQQEFFREQEYIIDDTCLTEYTVKKSTRELKDIGLIFVEKKGIPAKNYYKINTTRLLEMITTSELEKSTTSECENNLTGECENLPTNKNNKEKNNINNNKKEKEKEKTIDDYLLEQPLELQDNLKEFLKMRKAIKKPMTTYAFKLMIGRLNKLTSDLERQKKILEQSIVHCWQDIYDLKENVSYETKPNKNLNYEQRKYTKEQLDGLFTNLDEVEI